uniref:Putative tigger transposase n=1 Tax=Amblyomma cajennense TaxID=34607 RepID=A0A023FNB6_AMBCJ
MPKSTRPKYRVLTVKEKLDIIRSIENGTTKSAQARAWDLPLTTVCGIWNAREKLKSGSLSNMQRCRLRGSAFPEVEEALVLWLKKARSENLPVTGPLLAEKADVFAAQLNCKDFSCSNGWLARFKARYSISSRVVCGEAAHADKEGAEEWQNGLLQQELTSYAAEDVFNLDESALFYRLLPNRTLAFKGEHCTGGKLSKERVSVAFAVNMTGSQKLPLLVIGRYANPRCFKGGRLPSGVIYRSNQKAWMTAKLFEEYIRLLDRRFMAEKRKILLVLDNASCHSELKNLGAIKLFFLPPNTTALAQPLDQGIIRSAKHHYRKNLLRRMLLAMESGKMYLIDLLGAVHLLAFSWQQVDPVTIQNCFARAKFIVGASDSEDCDPADDCDTLLTEVLERQGGAEAVNFEMFCEVDSEVATTPGWSDSEIVAAVAPPQGGEEDAENEDSGDELPTEDFSPTVAEASQALAVMRAFAEKRGLMEKLAPSLSNFETAVVAARPPRRQLKMTDFWSAAQE